MLHGFREYRPECQTMEQAEVALFAGTGRLNVEFAAQAAEADTVQQCTCFAWASAGGKVQPEGSGY